MADIYGVYLIDSDSTMLDCMIRAVSWRKNGFNLVGYHNDLMTSVNEIIRVKPHLVVFDTADPRTQGIRFMEMIQNAGVGCKFIILSAFWSKGAVRDFFLQDGFEYLLKPLNKWEMEHNLKELYNIFSKDTVGKTGGGRKFITPTVS